MRVLWTLARCPTDADELTASQKLFIKWGPDAFPEAAWSARQAMDPANLSHRGARRMLKQLEGKGILRRHT